MSVLSAGFALKIMGFIKNVKESKINEWNIYK
jgi:hypothetical protein